MFEEVSYKSLTNLLSNAEEISVFLRNALGRKMYNELTVICSTKVPLMMCNSTVTIHTY